jgi:hypothetical protein
MSTPLRIQRRRVKGWRLPPNAVCVTRPHSAFQNRYRIGTRSNWLGRDVASAQEAVDCFAQIIMAPAHIRAYAREMLCGKNLACWCRLCPRHDARGGKPLDERCADCAPCHVDPLGAIANGFDCAAAA